ncbi:hypothetical protein [Methylobacterium planeticum]|uniref:Uncharacterized protein n=1 Tax=Methylobacterium planeticum TaxID=2615211 RepID=A0A6N6MR03_9HYPH|nr:hypothetical protein [Methylobacterium planeticum]KAB1073598.1 hypothetical protein F6X51_10365 [Methylobacterium planeticum]
MTDTDKLAELEREFERLNSEIKNPGTSGDPSAIGALMPRLIEVQQEILDLREGQKDFGKPTNPRDLSRELKRTSPAAI